jgi:hypothetical protein
MNNISIEFSNIDSSNIKYLMYQGISRGTGSLKVDFSTGVSYQYSDVEFNTVLQIISAESIGQVFRTLIVNSGRYKYKKI